MGGLFVVVRYEAFPVQGKVVPQVTEGLSLPCAKGGGTRSVTEELFPPDCLYNPPPPFGQSPLYTRGPILPFDRCAVP